LGYKIGWATPGTRLRHQDWHYLPRAAGPRAVAEKRTAPCSTV